MDFRFKQRVFGFSATLVPEAQENEEGEKELKGFYEGDRDHGQRHGFGIFYFFNGARYIGTWRRGLKHGTGTFIYPDGSMYEGQFWENKKHGYGCYTYSNGDIYNGQWHMDKPLGSGSYCSANTGHTYHGYWRDGKLQGRTNITMNDVRYVGNFLDNQPIGPAVFVLPNNISVRGKYIWQGRKPKAVWIAKGYGPAYP